MAPPPRLTNERARRHGEGGGDPDVWDQSTGGSGRERRKKNTGSNLKNQNEGVSELKNSPNFYWSYIQLPRIFFNKNHSKIVCNLVAIKRTKLLILNFPRILWLDSKDIQFHKNILKSTFEIYNLNKIFGGIVA